MPAENVEKSGMTGRVELRSIPVEESYDRDAFELAQFPVMFLPAPILTAGLEGQGGSSAGGLRPSAGPQPRRDRR